MGAWKQGWGVLLLSVSIRVGHWGEGGSYVSFLQPFQAYLLAVAVIEMSIYFLLMIITGLTVPTQT